MYPTNEFRKYAINHRNISSNTYDSYVKSMTPYIIEERQMNVSPDGRILPELMMDRIIFLGTGIDTTR